MDITEERYMEASENNEGYCPECEDFTSEFAEPDAEGYNCPECGCNSVVGAEQALLLGYITF